jgi:hypothetical protein
MRRVHILFFTLVIASVLAIMQQYALEYYLYWVYWWFDVVMHAIGGFVIGLFVYAAGYRTLLRLVLAVIVVGIVWELFEYVIGVMTYEDDVLFDTILDLVMDTIGALGAYGIMRWWEPKSQSPFIAERAASPDQTSL